ARHQWWESVLQSGMLAGAMKDQEGNWAVSSQSLLQAIKDHSLKPEAVNPTNVGRFMRAQGAELKHRESGNAWKLPPFAIARKVWEVKFHDWKWDERAIDWNDRTDIEKVSKLT